MKLLAFVDVHGNKRALKSIISKSKKKNPDLLICAGDISLFGRDLKKIISQFKKLDKPLIILPGNHEEGENLRKICSKFKFIIYLHKASYKINDYLFFGYGGGGFSMKDKGFERLSEKFRKTIKKEKVILVTHAPVYRTRLDIIPGLGHRGNKSIRRFVKKVKPVLVICGHFHENNGVVDTLGKTIIMNPGPYGKIIKV
jgi:hypothetical protein